MANEKQNNGKRILIIAGIALFIIISLGGTQELIEPNNLQDYDLKQLGIQVIGATEEQWESRANENFKICDFYQIERPKGTALVCGGANLQVFGIGGLQIQDIKSWSEGQYDSCNNFFKGNPHAYLLGTDPIPCYMQKLGETQFPLYQDYSPNSEGICKPCGGGLCYPYYSCSENDLFILQSLDSDVIYDYHQAYTKGPDNLIQKEVQFTLQNSQQTGKKPIINT